MPENYKPKKKKVVSYWDIVWTQFKKRKTAMFSLWIVIFFFFIAIFAPFIAGKIPLLLYTSYGEFYKYRFASWKKSHENYVFAITNRDKLKKKKLIAKKEFDTLKSKISELNKENDRYGNSYDDLREKITELEEINADIKEELIALQILKRKKVKAYKELLKQNKKGEKQNDINRLNIEINKITKKIKKIERDIEPLLAPNYKKIKPLEKAKKEVGGKQNKVKTEMFKKKSRQDEVNIQLIQLKSQLNYKNLFTLITGSLKGLKFPVSLTVQHKIDQSIEQYQKIRNQYERNRNNKSSNNVNQQLFRQLNDLQKSVAQSLSYSSIKEELEKKITFPVLNSLTILNIVLISTFIFFLLLPLINKLLTRFQSFKAYGRKPVLYLFTAFIFLSIVLLLTLRTNPIPTNYKKLIITNFLTPPKENTLKVDLKKIKKSKEDYVIFPFAPFGFNENFFEEKYQRPSILKYISSKQHGRHLLGTDETGRDVFSRMVWGARISLSVGFVAVSIYVLIGVFVGALAGYFGGLIDMIISRIIEIVICFPSFFLILTVIAFVGPSITNIMIVIGFTGWTGVARLTRGEFLKLRTQDFVTAAKSLGVSNFSIIFKHILPNALTPVLVSATFGIASAMLIEAGLSFLGFGVREPLPSWGQMISVGQSDVINYWWLSLIPGFAIFISVTTYNLVGEALRESIDPRLKE